MANSKLTWERLSSATNGAPDVWRTPVVGGWLVSHAHALTFVPDADQRWAPKVADDDISDSGAFSRHQRSDRVVHSPAPGVATTEAELEAFRVVEELCAMHDAAPDPSRLAYTDTESFFVIHLGSPLSWAIRIAFVASADSWVSFNLNADDAQRLAPNVRFLGAGFGGEVRVACDHPNDLRDLAPLVIAALAASA